jgi:periplasmic protein TonB
MAGYPPFARRDHIEGSAVVSFVVTVRGAVRDTKIVQSTGDGDLDNASVACVMPWLFDPAMQNGKPVEVVEKIRQVWQLDK